MDGGFDENFLITLTTFFNKLLICVAPCWKSLLLNGQFAPDQWTFDQMQRKLTLERYQIEHPGFDFSSAEISGNYVSGGYHP